MGAKSHMFRKVAHALMACGVWGAAASGVAATITYTVDSQYTSPSRTGSTGPFTNGAATGKILDGTTQIGTWTMSNWQVKELIDRNFTGSPPFTVAAFGAPATGWYSGIAGVAVESSYPPASGTTSTPGGATQYGYSVQGSITVPGYRIAGVQILGAGSRPGVNMSRGPNGSFTPDGTTVKANPTDQGGPIYPLGSLSFSGFGGTATLTNPTVTTVVAGGVTGSVITRANLNATDGSTATGSLSIDKAFNAGNGSVTVGDGYDWTVGNTAWKLSSNAGDSMTFAADYGGRGSAREDTAFSFNVLPLPDMTALLNGFPASAAPGAVVSGTLICSNQGPGVATDPSCGVDLSALPAGASINCNTPSLPLAVGGKITCTVTYTQPASGTTVHATTGATDDYDIRNNFASIAVPIPPDMSAALTGLPTTPVAPGTTVHGTLTCTNLGGVPAPAPTCGVTSTLPAGSSVTCTPAPAPDPLPVGGKIVCDITYPQPAGTGITLQGATSATGDYNPANNTVSQTVPTTADVSATLSGFPPTASPGDQVTGTLTCTNRGPGDAVAPSCAVTGLPSGATVTCSPDPVPATLAMGASISCAVTYTQPAGQVVTIVGTAGAQNDSNPANNVASLAIGAPQAVPTLGEWAQLLLALLMGLLAVAALRARQR